MLCGLRAATLYAWHLLSIPPELRSSRMESATKPVSYRVERRPRTSDPVPLGGSLKRAFDLSSALVALCLLIPLFITVAALLKLSGSGPIFYRHNRIGYSGRMFGCLKFRTMVNDGDAVLEAYFKQHPEARSLWLRERKLPNDPRVTKLGAFLRKSSLDELPQLFNIIKGEMSIVGPRPVISDEINMYGPAAAAYLRARPGLTGLWQVSGRNDTSYTQRVELDHYYVENWSLSGDIVIILKTVPAVCLSRGSY
jgi:exopolysaccharide production protein ExoY